MLKFQSDYLEGAHPKIIDALVKTNLDQTSGYSEDEYCENAKLLIKKACQNDNVDVHFLVGGTQTNFTVISATLRTHEGVISADTGHINVHETGAVEACGHKVLPITNVNGKLCAQDVEDYVIKHINDDSFEHIVKPGMVYISNPTEIGTVYSKKELTELRSVCDKYGMALFMDGARLGYALASPENDLTLKDISELCDVFYIGGTKVGALFGEAVVIKNPNIKKDFRYIIKQKGGMLAKGRLLGIQFGVLFTDGLYFEISKKAVELANRFKETLAKEGIRFMCDSTTNQQFPILKDSTLEALKDSYSFSFWEKHDDTTSVVRVCTSFATTDEMIEKLALDIINCEKK